MATLQMTNRFTQTMLNLSQADRDRVTELLERLQQDPLAESLSQKAVVGIRDLFVLRVSDRLRLLYRREWEGGLSGTSTTASIIITIEDIVSRESLRHYLPGGDE